MNKFSKITGIIAFWSKLIVFLGTVLIFLFQRQIMKLFTSDEAILNCFVFPFKEFFLSLFLLVIVALFCFVVKTNNKNRAILSLYFYIFVTLLFSNPFLSYISAMLSSVRGVTYMAAVSNLSSSLQSILYIFTVVSTVCFYLAVGSLIVLGDSENQNTEVAQAVSSKSKSKLVMYSAFLGVFGVDRFYAGKIASGFIKLILFLLTVGLTKYLFYFIESSLGSYISLFMGVSAQVLLIFVFSVIDFVLCVLGKFRDSEKKPIVRW